MYHFQSTRHSLRDTMTLRCLFYPHEINHKNEPNQTYRIQTLHSCIQHNTFTIFLSRLNGPQKVT